MSINQHITSSVLVYLQCTYLFSHCSFLGCPPSQDIKCHQYFKYQSKSPNTRTIPTLRVSPLCYSRCLSLFFSLQFKPPNKRAIPCTPLSGISFRVLHQAKALRSRTPPQRLEVILFTESLNSCDSPLMCAKRVLTTCLTSRRPQNA